MEREGNYHHDHFATWSAYSTLGRAVCYSFHLTNVFALVIALLGICYGTWMVAARSSYAALVEPRLYVDVGYILLVVGAMAVCNCLLGTYYTLQQMRCFMVSYSIGAFILFVMLAIGGAMGYVFRYQLVYQTLMPVKMLTSLRELYGLDDRTELTYAWDELQRNFECCAVDGDDNYSVYRTSKWYMRQRPSEGQPKAMLPESCCARTPSGDFVSKKECLYFDRAHPPTSSIHKQTCYHILQRELLNCALIGGSISLALSIVLLIPASFAAVFACLIQK